MEAAITEDFFSGKSQSVKGQVYNIYMAEMEFIMFSLVL